jgi:hypothetical protein
MNSRRDVRCRSESLSRRVVCCNCIVRGLLQGMVRNHRRQSPVGRSGPAHTTGMAATVGDFHQCKKRGVTNTGRILATRDTAIGEIHPVPEASIPASFACRGPRLLPQQALLAGDPDFHLSKLCLPGTPGCGEKRAILRCRPRTWNHQAPRTPPRMARFSLATLFTSVVNRP